MGFSKGVILCLFAMTATAVAGAHLVDQLANGARHVKQTAETTGREAASAARSAADAAQRAAHTAATVKRMADDSGLTGAVINAGKDAVQRGVHALTPSHEPRQEPLVPTLDAPYVPERLEPAVTPRKQPKQLPAAPPKPRQAHESHPITIDPAMLSVLAIALAAIIGLVAAACVVVRIRAHRIRAVHDKAMVAALQPIFAVATPALAENPPPSTAIAL
jgi:hypothetical protein